MSDASHFEFADLAKENTPCYPVWIRYLLPLLVRVLRICNAVSSYSYTRTQTRTSTPSRTSSTP
eukprot:scaffold308675_cov24-Prasinocladus_malaysianus.AAC.1